MVTAQKDRAEAIREGLRRARLLGRRTGVPGVSDAAIRAVIGLPTEVAAARVGLSLSRYRRRRAAIERADAAAASPMNNGEH